MDTTTLIILLVILGVVLLAVVGYTMWSSKKKRSGLKERFGPEYDRTVEESGRRQAERDLAERQKRVEKLQLKELSSEDRHRFGEEWRTVQARFVDDPTNAITEADQLVERLMDARGYPVKDFDTQRKDVSVDHPEVVKNYEAAHSIADASRQGNASTEQLRQGMIHYRALFSDLLGSTPVGTSG